MDAPKRVMKEAEAAQYLGLSASLLRQMRLAHPRATAPHGPVYVKIGRAVRYLVDDLDAWLAMRRQVPTKKGLLTKVK